MSSVNMHFPYVGVCPTVVRGQFFTIALLHWYSGMSITVQCFSIDMLDQ